jgi:transposase
MKKTTQHLIAEVPRRQPQGKLTIGIDLGDVWSHYCTLNEGGEVVDRGRFRTTPKAIEKWFTDLLASMRGDGSRNAFDLDQRATAGAGP